MLCHACHNPTTASQASTSSMKTKSPGSRRGSTKVKVKGTHNTHCPPYPRRPRAPTGMQLANPSRTQQSAGTHNMRLTRCATVHTDYCYAQRYRLLQSTEIRSDQTTTMTAQLPSKVPQPSRPRRPAGVHPEQAEACSCTGRGRGRHA
jgi:hypothetical protein